MSKLRKGALVKAKQVDEFDSPIKGFYHHTSADIEEWRQAKRNAMDEAMKRGEDTFDIAFDSAGEPRLPPRHSYKELNPSKVYEVLRARCRVERGYSIATGQVKILDTESGRELYCERDDLVVVA